MEIHFFWAGKGTCCVPTQGYYGPAISAISVSPGKFTTPFPKKKKSVLSRLCAFGFLIIEKFSDFVPTVSNTEPRTSKSKTGLIVGIVVAVVVSGLLVVLAVLVWRYKIKKKEMDEGIIVNVPIDVSIDIALL